MTRARLSNWQTPSPSLKAPDSSSQLPLLTAESYPGGQLEAELRSKLPPPRPPGQRRTARSRSIGRGRHLQVRETAFFPQFDGQQPATLAEPRTVERYDVDGETGEIINRISMRRVLELRARGLMEISTADWDVAGDCERPGFRFLHTRAEARGEGTEFGAPALKTYVVHRCKRCRSCLKARSQSWFYRIQAECAGACGAPRSRMARTWLMTLTMQPEWHDFIRYRAIAAFDAGGKACHPSQAQSVEALPCIEWEELSEFERSRLLNIQYHKEFQQFVDRVEGRLQTKFRYFCIGEKHPGRGSNANALHWHALLHEVPGMPQLKQDIVEDCWVAYVNEVDRHARQQGRQANGRFGRRALMSNAGAGRICSMSVVRDPLGAGRYALKYCLKGGTPMRVYASKRYGRAVDVSLLQPTRVGDGDGV